jgi:iron complex outermembrane recepter protein
MSWSSRHQRFNISISTFAIISTILPLQSLAEEAGADAEVLTEVTVTGWRPSSVDGYNASLVSSFSKTESSILETPGSVSIVTEELFKDQNASNLSEVLRNVAGVGTGPNAANVSVQESFTIRGFTSPLIRVNGVQRRSTGPLSLANVESVEVLKGPASVLYGDVSPGGFINIQTKRPQREQAIYVEGDLNQNATGRGTMGGFEFDATGALNDSGTVLYRFITAADGGSSFIDENDREQYFIAPSLSYVAPDDSLRVDLDLTFLRNDETFEFGVPAKGDRITNKLGYSDFLGSKNSDKVTEDFTAELRANYQFNAKTEMDAAITYHRNEHFSKALRPFGSQGQQVAADDTVRRSFSLRSFVTTDTQLETNLIHNALIGDTAWRFLVGADVRRTKLEHTGPGFGNIANFDRVNLGNPDNDTALPSADSSEISRFADTKEVTDAYGVYAQSEVWLTDALMLQAGLRYTRLDYTFKDDEPFRFNETPDNVDPRFAALYKINDVTSVYASYSSSFEQSFSFDEANTKPFEAKQTEAGLKFDLFNGKALATASVFKITQKNRPVFNNETDRTESVGEDETKGFELELRGQVTDHLMVSASYAYLDNEVTKDINPDRIGNRNSNVPENEAALWLSYSGLQINNRPLKLNLGVFYEDKRFTNVSTNRVSLPSYTIVDTGASYAFNLSGSEITLQGGIKNLFDREYFTSGFGDGIAFRGEPRTVYLKASTTF